MPNKATLSKAMRASPMLEMLLYEAQQVPFYPNEKYLKRGWAPEKMPRDSVLKLADAEKRAVTQGVLPASLANALLPTAMVEGHDRNYGIVNSTYGYPANPQRDEVMQKMGLEVGYSDQDYPHFKDVDVIRDTQAGYWVPSGKWSDDPEGAHRAQASLVPIIMAEKARLYGQDKAIERWNGRGRGWEDTGDDYVRSDSGYHARKVEEAMRMLKHPANKRLYDEYLYRMLTE